MEHSGHESKDADVRGIVTILAGLAVSVAVVGVLVYGIFRYMAEHPLSTVPANPLVESVQIPPPPRVDPYPAMELQELHRYEDNILTTYGWTDAKKGIARIPIDQAMQLQLQRGFPTAPPASKTGAAKK
jgi:hypothetical protein